LPSQLVLRSDLILGGLSLKFLLSLSLGIRLYLLLDPSFVRLARLVTAEQKRVELLGIDEMIRLVLHQHDAIVDGLDDLLEVLTHVLRSDRNAKTD
jgi:hypothetical protein